MAANSRASVSPVSLILNRIRPVTFEPDPVLRSPAAILVIMTTVVDHPVDTALDVKVVIVIEAPAVHTMTTIVVDTDRPQESGDLLMNTHPFVGHSRILTVATTHLTHTLVADPLQETTPLQEIILREKPLMIMNDRALVTN
ncbi:hypothetical protein WAI453_002892 [Rhynchosporium graminicola]